MFILVGKRRYARLLGFEVFFFPPRNHHHFRSFNVEWIRRFFFCFSSTIAAYLAAIFAAATLANYDSSFYRINASSRTWRSRSRRPSVRPRFNSTSNLETTT
uniref:(northern house mosquito) hypothetical protein n=1 Tax=Culex pipiens TaxID=7175 RepID=A0A8D8L014_CULPI